MPFPRPGVPGRDATSKNTTDNQGFFASVVQPDVTGEKVGHFCCWPVPRLRESDRRDCCCFVIATAALRTSTGTGKVRIYFRRKGQRNIVLTETPGTRSSRPTQRVFRGELGLPSAIRHAPARLDSLRWLCAQYYASAKFKLLAASTQTDRRRILEAICDVAVNAASSIIPKSDLHRESPAARGDR